METEIKNASFDVEFKADSDGIGGFEGYASFFGNVDSYGDVVEAGSFAKTIKEFKKNGSALPLLWQHDTRLPIGVIKSMREDENGLFVSGVFADTQAGKEGRELLKLSAVKKMSIGYRVKQARYDEKKGLRYLQEIELMEISLVTFPANDKAAVTSVKNGELPKTKRMFEQLLVDIGYSKRAAKGIASCGFQERDALEADAEGTADSGRDALAVSVSAVKAEVALADIANIIRSFTNELRGNKGD